MHQGHVFLHHGSLLNGPAQPGGGLTGSGVDHAAAHMLVQPVDGENRPAQSGGDLPGQLLFRVQPHGLEADGDLPVGVKKFHGIAPPVRQGFFHQYNSISGNAQARRILLLFCVTAV